MFRKKKRKEKGQGSRKEKSQGVRDREGQKERGRTVQDATGTVGLGLLAPVVPSSLVFLGGLGYVKPQLRGRA